MAEENTNDSVKCPSQEEPAGWFEIHEGDRERFRFNFSVIIAVYNMENYLAEAVDSLIHQTIGFKDNIQIILVDDGSTDGSREICERYAAEWPDNVICLHQDNAGVSAARNAGLPLAQGQYLNFLDADDAWSEDAFLKAAKFLKKHPSLRIASARHRFFGAKEEAHPLDYKFKKTRVVHLLSDPEYMQLTVNSAWLHRDLMEGRSFATGLSVAEDFLLINSILLEEPVYGVLSAPVYRYRKRKEGGSAIDTSKERITWYLDTPRLCYEGLFRLSTERYGNVLPFIQYAVMYDLQWRLKSDSPHPLSEEQYEEYREICRGLLQEISNPIILAQRNIFRDHKLAILAFKRGTSTEKLSRWLMIVRNDMCLRGADSSLLRLWDLKWERRMELDFLERRGEKLYLEGRLYTLLPKKKIKVRVKAGSKWVSAKIFRREDLTKSTFFEKDALVAHGFSVTFPARSFSLYLYLNGLEVTPWIDVIGKFFPIGKKSYDYTILDNRKAPKTGQLLVTRKDNRFTVARCGRYRGRLRLLSRERKFERAVRRKGSAQEKAALPLRRRAFLHRLFPWLYKKIWLISDRTNLAGDNGEALFTYLQEHPVPGVKTYFLIEKSSPDYERMRKTGRVVPWQSARHRRLYARADRIISSAGEEIVFFPFPEAKELLRGLTDWRYVFLQHGITKDDLSQWTRRWNKNISLFCTSAPAEFSSIAGNPRYGYTGKQVKLTGFARHDGLLRETANRAPQKRILIAPTWRNALALPCPSGTAVHPYNPAFRSSDYYRFYEALLNDEELRAAAGAQGYTARFLLHPSHISNLPDFTSSWCEIAAEYHYREEFLGASILLTDYSSVMFDFAALKKPVLYAQFDRESFFYGQVYSEGYFDYRRDGFGPVCDTYEETKAALLRLMENPVLEEPYLTRVEQFYGPLDGRACERITAAIQALDRG